MIKGIDLIKKKMQFKMLERLLSMSQTLLKKITTFSDIFDVFINYIFYPFLPNASLQYPRMEKLSHRSSRSITLFHFLHVFESAIFLAVLNVQCEPILRVLRAMTQLFHSRVLKRNIGEKWVKYVINKSIEKHQRSYYLQ